MQSATDHKELNVQQQIMNERLEITITALMEKNNKGQR